MGAGPYGGGPTTSLEHDNGAEPPQEIAPAPNEPTQQGVDVTANGPPPSGSAAAELPGMPPPGMFGEATEANGGSGAGYTGSKGEGATLTNGRNQLSTSTPPAPEGVPGETDWSGKNKGYKKSPSDNPKGKDVRPNTPPHPKH